MKRSVLSISNTESQKPRLPGQHPQAARQAGFSLLEILVVMALLAVLSTIGATMFIKVSDAWRTAHTRTDLIRTSDAFFSQFRKDVQHMLATQQTGIALHGEAVEYTESDSSLPLYDVPRGVDSITLPVTMPVSDQGYERRYAVTYAVDNSVSPPALHRSTRPLDILEGDLSKPLSPNDIEESQILLEGVIALRLEYYNGQASPQEDAAWTTSWDGEKHPRAIRMGLVLAHPDRLDRQLSRQATFYTALQ